MIRLLLALLLASSACVHVPAYERGFLMSRAMAAPNTPLEATFDAHVHLTREAMQGAEPEGSVSCGCN